MSKQEALMSCVGEKFKIFSKKVSQIGGLKRYIG